jgi:site-specific DNA-methyltransferase (adenine-specific)
LRRFFVDWGRLAGHALRPGVHVFIATNAFIAQLLYAGLVEAGLEFRGQLIRLVRTLHGGDRPRNAEEIYPDSEVVPSERTPRGGLNSNQDSLNAGPFR